jgi:hypothetical protein
MALLTVQRPVVSGITPTYGAAAGGGDTFAPATAGLHFIHIKNGGGAPINLTINDPTSQGPPSATQFNPDVVVAVTNGQERMIAIDPARFINPANGLVELTYSAVTSVTIGIFRL